jgi:hypothetical protein
MYGIKVYNPEDGFASRNMWGEGRIISDCNHSDIDCIVAFDVCNYLLNSRPVERKRPNFKTEYYPWLLKTIHSICVHQIAVTVMTSVSVSKILTFPLLLLLLRWDETTSLWNCSR